MWLPRKRNVKYSEKPAEIPDAIYQEALAAKHFFNENWEFWVHSEAVKSNRPVPETEDACIRGIQKAILRCKLVYGDAVGEWYERYLDMGDIFRKVKHPTYIKALGD